MRYRKIAMVIISFAALGIVIAVAVVTRKPVQQPLVQNSPPIAPPPSTTSTTKATGTLGTKTYRNTEYGFEFRYPDDWSFHASTFYSPSSKFNLVGASPEESGHPDPLTPSILVNIVTPDFADRAFYDLKNIVSETKVGGIEGSKYEYEYEELRKIAIVLPFGQYKIILGAYKVHEDTFNQILASFKFLK